MDKIWIITSEYNQYDQYGEYFCKAFKTKPTHKQCMDFLLSVGYISEQQSKQHKDKKAALLMKGGGRVDFEDKWYNLREEELE